MIIHGNFNMGAVETWKGTFDSESITALPDQILLEGYVSQSARVGRVVIYIFSC